MMVISYYEGGKVEVGEESGRHVRGRSAIGDGWLEMAGRKFGEIEAKIWQKWREEMGHWLLNTWKM